jgi:cytochrome P450
VADAVDQERTRCATPALFSSRRILSVPFEPGIAQVLAGALPEEQTTLIGLDPPIHTRLRAVMNTAFTPARAQAMEDQIRQVANDLVDGFAADGQADLMSGYAYPLTLSVILALIGVPAEAMEHCRRQSQDWGQLVALAAIGAPLAEQAGLARSAAELGRYLRRLIDERGRRPTGDLISALWQARRGDHQLTDEEMFSLIPGLIFAGHATTACLIGSAVWLLLSRPSLWQTMAADSGVARDIVEEVLRLEPSTPGMPRIVTAGTELAGVRLAAGDRVYACFISANHDQACFSEPEDFCPTRRSGPPHLGFGRGPHFCLGAPLARLETRIALQTLARRLPGLRLATSEPCYQPHLILRGPQELPVSWTTPAHGRPDASEARQSPDGESA